MATQTQLITETPASESEIPEQQPNILERTIAATDERSQDFAYVQRIAKPFAVSGLFGATYEQAIAKIMVGEALGIHPAVAMQQIHIFAGKVSMSSGLMLSLARKNGWRHTVKKRDDTACVIAWTDPSGVAVGDSSFTIEDARRVKLDPKEGKDGKTMADKDNWRNYPRAMCFARAVSEGLRTYGPEVTNGIPVYTTEELADITPEPAGKPEVQMPERASRTEVKTEAIA